MTATWRVVGALLDVAWQFPECRGAVYALLEHISATTLTEIAGRLFCPMSGDTAPTRRLAELTLFFSLKGGDR